MSLIKSRREFPFSVKTIMFEEEMETHFIVHYTVDKKVIQLTNLFLIEDDDENEVPLNLLGNMARNLLLKKLP